MSIIREYLGGDGGPDSPWQDERKKYLAEISRIRKRAVITFAARIAPAGVPVPAGMNYGDLLPFFDLLDDLSGPAVDVILETPGGDGVIAREIVERLHEKFADVAFIIPGWAKSAGTIMSLGGNEILMGPNSALGPIDAQLTFEGKVFSADALLDGMKAIEDDTIARARLNPAHIPMLQRISPGDLQHARNALDFAKVTVAEWLAKYKFANWTHHRTTNPGTPVTAQEKEVRATEIAAELCKHSRWKTHGRSLRLADLRALHLEIVDYSLDADLNAAIQRYFVLLRLLLDGGNAYKIIETIDGKVIQRFNLIQNPAAPAPTNLASTVVAEVACNACGHKVNVQMNLAANQPTDPQAVQYPANDELSCSKCGAKVNLKPVRDVVEKQFGRPLVV